MNVIHFIKLLLPALLPSWNFFDVIVPSPRIQISLLKDQNQPATEWSEFRPRCKELSLPKMFAHMIWNARWNESLFMVSCAERLMEYPTQHSEEEIFKRIIKEITSNKTLSDIRYVKFRLVFIRREGEKLVEEVQYESSSRIINNKEIL